MAKTYSITVRITAEQKKFIDQKIAHIKDKVDVEVPAGLVIRKLIEKAMHIHEAKLAGKGQEEMAKIRHYFRQKFGEEYYSREKRIEDLLNLIEEYKASETTDSNED
jgi:hypothetical protein